MNAVSVGRGPQHPKPSVADHFTLVPSLCVLGAGSACETPLYHRFMWDLEKRWLDGNKWIERSPNDPLRGVELNDSSVPERRLSDGIQPG